MYNIIDKTGQSYDDISRQLYGTASRAGDLAKLNNNVDGQIIVFGDDNLISDGDGISLNVEGKIYRIFDDAVLNDIFSGIKSGIFIFEIGQQNFKIGQNCSIYNNNGLFLNGCIKNIVPNLDNIASKVKLEVKSYAGILIDSVVPFPLEFHSVSLRTVLTNFANYFGLSISFADDSRLDLISSNEIDNSFAAHLDEKAWDYLVRITSARGLLIEDTGNGLYVGNADDQQFVISFIEGETVGVTDGSQNLRLKSWQDIMKRILNILRAL